MNARAKPSTSAAFVWQAERDANDAARVLRRHALRDQDVARLGVAGGACRARGDGVALAVEREHEQLGADARDEDEQMAGQAFGAGRDDGALCPRAPPRGGRAARAGASAADLRRREGCREPDRRRPRSRCPSAGRAPGPRPTRAAASARACARRRQPTPFGPPSLCAERASDSTPEAPRPTGKAAAACTASQWNGHAALGGRRRQALDRLHRAGDVVRPHHRREPVAGLDQALELLGVDDAVAVDRRPGDLEPAPLELAGRLAHGRMLDRAHDEPAGRRPGEPEHGLVVGLGAARGEDDLARLGVRAAPPAARGPPRARRGRRARNVCGSDAFPNRSDRYGSIAARASGASGVVAAWSR